MPGSEQPPQGWPGWPGGKKFAFVLTHDVESATGLNRARRLAEMEMAFGFRSCFNFVPEGDYRVTKELRDWLRDNGFEVGVHDIHHDGKLFRSQRDFAKRAPLINHYLKEWDAIGFRSGFMICRQSWLHELDIAYDMSTFDTDPFEPQPRGVNTIFPFWVPRGPEVGGQNSEVRIEQLEAASPNSQPSTVNQPRSGYVELPYTMPQDFTLFLLLKERNAERWERKLSWLCRHQGMVLMNVHPDYIGFPDNGSGAHLFPSQLFEGFLRKVSTEYRDQYWNPKPRELAEWFSQALSASKSISSIGSQAHALPQPKKGPLAGKRAAVVLYSYYPSDPRPRRAAESMIQAGMSVDLFCLRETESEPQRETVNGVKVRRLPLERKRGSKSGYVLQYSRFLIACSLILGHQTLSSRYDVVHVHNMPDVLAFSALVPKLFGARVILDLHDPMPELMRSIYQLLPNHWLVRVLVWLERWSIAFADLVLTPNTAFRDLFVSRGHRPDKIKIVMNSPEADLFDPARFPSDAATRSERNGSFKLMFHGLIAERHGLDTAIHAVARLQKEIRGLEFHIYGDRTPYMDQISELIKTLGLEGTVLYHGRKSHHEIAKALASINLGIIPNRRNPFTDLNMPTRIFENLAMGSPVVVPNTKGIRDYFKDNQIIFFEPDNAESLAQAINWAYLHPHEVQQMVLRAQEVLSAHTWTNEREQFVQRLQELVSA
jgi:glycosyltransferase involved in cell wall biosynthesis